VVYAAQSREIGRGINAFWWTAGFARLLPHTRRSVQARRGDEYFASLACFSGGGSASLDEEESRWLLSFSARTPGHAIVAA
jgi:hypothetical protein